MLRAAEEIASKVISETWTGSAMSMYVRMINEARKEAIEECAKAAKIKWVDIEYDEEKRDMVCEPEIDRQSILSLIKLLK